MTNGQQFQNHVSVKSLVAVFTLVGLLAGGMIVIDTRYAAQEEVDSKVTLLRCDLLEYQINHVTMMQQITNNTRALQSRRETLLRRWSHFCGGHDSGSK